MSGLHQDLVFLVSKAGENLLGTDYFKRYKAIARFTMSRDYFYISPKAHRVDLLKDSRITKTINVFNSNARAVVDTGCADTYIKRELVPSRLLSRFRSQKIPVQAIGVQKKLTMCVLPPQDFTINGDKCVCPELRVCSYPNNKNIIGINFLRLNNATLDFSK